MPSLNDLWTAFLAGGGAVTPSNTSPALAGNGNFASVTNAGLQVGATGSRRLYTYNVANPNAAISYLNFYNKATVPALGTDAPLDWIAIAANGVVDGDWTASPAFSLGMWIAATTLPGGTVAPAAPLVASLGFA